MGKWERDAKVADRPERSFEEFPGRRAGENRLIIVCRESFNGTVAGVEVAAGVGAQKVYNRLERQSKKCFRQFYQATKTFTSLLKLE